MLLRSLNLVYLYVVLVGKAYELIRSHFSNSNKNNETICWFWGVHKQEHYNQHRLLFSKLHPGYHKIIHPLPSQEDKQMRGVGRILCGFASTTLTETFEKNIVSNDTPQGLSTANTEAVNIVL